MRTLLASLLSLGLTIPGFAQTVSGPALDGFFDGAPSLSQAAVPAEAPPPTPGAALSPLSPLSERLDLRVSLAAAPEPVPVRPSWSTQLKMLLITPLAALALPMGRIEGWLRSRSLLERYPGARILGGGHSNVVAMTDTPEGRRVIKLYGATGTLLAALSRFALPVANPGGIGRAHRHRSDRAAFQDFEAAGIPASRVVDSDPELLANVSTFVSGKPLMSLVRDDASVAASGRSLRMAHDRGWAIIDNQPSNFVIGADGRAYFIDLEHAWKDEGGRYQAWDIGVYLSWFEAGLPAEEAAKAEAAFWSGYGPVSPELRSEIGRVRESMSIFPLRRIMQVSFKDSEQSS